MSKPNLGSRFRCGSQSYEVCSVYKDGKIVAKPIAQGPRWRFGDPVRLVGVTTYELAGVIVSSKPLRAKVTTPGVFLGTVVCGDYVRRCK